MCSTNPYIIENNLRTKLTGKCTVPLKNPLVQPAPRACPLALQFVLMLQVPQGKGEGDLVFLGEEGWEFLL